jgi:hypothetical protein
VFESDTSDAATVWPFGGSIWLAVAYRVFGEEGLYIATPLAALASLIAFTLLVLECFHERAMPERAVIAAISVVLLATSWEQVDRSLVPLVDMQAQLFSVLAVWGAVRAMNGAIEIAATGTPSWHTLTTIQRFLADKGRLRAVVGAVFNRCIILGVFAGLALGAAYLVRHTQVLLAIPIVFAVCQMPTRERARFVVAAAIAAFAVALPDLIYHQQNFGSWLTPESNELKHFALANLLPSAARLAERFFAGNEFGYLFPFFLYGMYRAARESAGRFVVLASWLGVLAGFHLFYEAVRMRDLLPEFPAVVLLTAYGMVALVRDSRKNKLLVWQGGAAIAIFLALLLTLTRTQLTFMRAFQPARVTFGYVTAAQRAAFNQIVALTPVGAVIGSTMNDGAIDLYAQRATFRPGEWSSAERAIFVAAMQRAGRRVFLLDDGAETSDARHDLTTRYALKKIAVLDVPLFSVVDGTPGTLWEVLEY